MYFLHSWWHVDYADRMMYSSCAITSIGIHVVLAVNASYYGSVDETISTVDMLDY